jgi:biopolymer transport protein ExbB
MLEVGVRNLGTSPALLEDMMLSVMLRRRPEMERFLSFLAVTAVASPLMGLLGTVAGMIHTFALMKFFGAGDPRALSSGISEALITTEFGLLIAIPAVAVHGILSRMVKSRLGDMERVAFEFVKTLSLEENADPAAAGAR